MEIVSTILSLEAGDNVGESGVRYRMLHEEVKNCLREGVLPSLPAPLSTT